MIDKEKFIPFLSFIEELITIEIFQYYDTPGFFKFIMAKILEFSRIEHLQLFMDHMIGSNQGSERHNFFRKCLRVNSSFLLDACEKANMDLVKVFIKYKCHLTISSHEREENTNWSSVFDPYGFDMTQTEKDSKDLKILKMMATKSYIFGCYYAMVETKGIQDCICDKISVTSESHEHRRLSDTAVIFFKTVLPRDQDFHTCPASEDFLPDFMDCMDHVECNDPISR